MYDLPLMCLGPFVTEGKSEHNLSNPSPTLSSIRLSTGTTVPFKLFFNMLFEEYLQMTLYFMLHFELYHLHDSSFAYKGLQSMVCNLHISQLSRRRVEQNTNSGILRSTRKVLDWEN
uniref:Uncharacterized protein n=1 Tax=Sphaerodactylus townsendi TaxID=933632 RepID=A0ACB8EXH4_9SAUR